MDWQTNFHREGYAILKDFFDPLNDFSQVKNQISELFKVQGENRDLFAPYNYKMNEEARALAYANLRYLPAVSSLTTDPRILDLCLNTGITLPALMKFTNVRMDEPNKDDFLFHWHQDIAYLLGSKNSLTFWVPLSKADEYHGSIELIPKSHLEGLFPVRYKGKENIHKVVNPSPKDIELLKEPKDESIIVEANPGDIVVLSQLLLHRSIPNHSDKIRWTLQCRYSDFAHKEFIEDKYPMGDKTNIFVNNYID